MVRKGHFAQGLLRIVVFEASLLPAQENVPECPGALDRWALTTDVRTQPGTAVMGPAWCHMHSSPSWSLYSDSTGGSGC